MSPALRFASFLVLKRKTSSIISHTPHQKREEQNQERLTPDKTESASMSTEFRVVGLYCRFH